MDSDVCQSCIATVISSLQKKIGPDSKNPTYIRLCIYLGKTVCPM
ncbi:hypothetical protein AALB64_11650 [Lachnospiraceae bacterium 45-P1]